MKKFPACKVIEKDNRLGIDVATRYGEAFQEALKGFKGYVQVILENPEKPATEAQNRAFHALIGLYFKSGLHSCSGYEDLRETIKKRYGLVKHITIDGEEYMILTSWSKYPLRERARTIDGLISEMEQAGILGSYLSAEYTEIIEGMNGKRQDD